MRLLQSLATATALLLLVAAAPGQVVQDITIDGVDDFDPANLIDADGEDTEFATIDLGDVFVTNDANNLYLGYEHDQGGWGTVQLGVAIDVGTPGGGTGDPWSRQLEWSGAANKPDFIFYINLDSDWQASYQWTGSWSELEAGVGALGVPTDTGFREYAILLSTLGVSAGDVINVEVWVTQDGDTKGPLDAAANDAVQLSTPGGTTFDVDDPVPMTAYHAFTILDATDEVPPTVQQAGMSADDQVFVSFSEPVGAGAEDVASYDLPGATITAAAIDPQQSDRVLLDLDTDLPVSASLYTVTVTGVQDLAGNVIADQNSADFLWKTVTFLGHMSRYLQDNSSPPDGFTVEGGRWPLTWELCDGAQMADLGGGDYQWSGNFSAPGDGEGGASATFEWKFVHDCETYEPLPDNRTHTLQLDGSDSDLIEVWWNDEDPADFTAHAIDVLFFVDMTEAQPAPQDTVAIAGNTPPLDQAWPPAVVMVDDGSGIDQTAGDGIYSRLVTFPADSRQDVTYKFRLGGEYECFGQGDRDLFLNDEEFDVIGGDLGPLELPVYLWDYCTISYRDVAVIFQVDASNVPHQDSVIAVNGTEVGDPPVFSWDIPSLNPMADDGVAPDQTAGDGVYTRAVVFPAGGPLDIAYKYLRDGEYEGFSGNRGLRIDPYRFDAAGNPQVVGPDVLQGPTGVGDTPAAAPLRLDTVPNPFNPRTEIRFTVHRAGEGALRIYTTGGRLVRTLHVGSFAAGAHAFPWDGRGDGGERLASGVYLARLQIAGQTGTRKLTLVK
jgi:hypothetical protein